MKKNLLLFAGLVFGFLLILSACPIDTSIENASSIVVTIQEVKDQGGPGDITFFVEESDVEFYVNRGTELGLRSNALSKILKGKDATIFFADHFTPLDPFGKHRHVVRIDIEGFILFDENNEPHYRPPTAAI